MEISQIVFDKNISCLRVINPTLAEKIKHYLPNKIDFKIVEGRTKTISISGFQISSRHDPVKEAVVQASAMPAHELIYLYGLGLGYLPEEVLKRKSIKVLNIKIMNLAIFSLILFLRDQRVWLNDRRVSLSLACQDIDAKAPYFAFPPELNLADDQTLRIRNILETDISYKFTKNQFRPNDQSLNNRIKDNYELLKKDKDVDALKGQAKGKEAVVVGAGPSLIANLPKLQLLLSKKERIIVICVATATKVLIAAGIHPDFVVIIDKDTPLNHPLLCDFSKMKNSNLIYFPLVIPEVLKAWQGARFLAYSSGAIFDEVKLKFPSGSLFSGGSVIHVATDLAVKLGCRKIIFFGADFAYPDNRTHAGHESGKLTNYDDVTPPQQATRSVKNWHGKDIKTLASFIGYLVELERYIKSHPEIEFQNSSKSGAYIFGTKLIEEEV